MWQGQRLTGLVRCLLRQERLTRLAFFEIEDQHAKLHICGIKCDEFPRMGQRGRKITGLLSYRHKSEKRVPIYRMAFVRRLKQLHRLSLGADGIQRDRVDIGIAPIAGGKLARAPQFRERLGIIVLTHECEAQRVPYIRIVRVNRHCLAQKLGAFLVLPAHAVEIGEVHERGRKVWVETQSRLVLILRLGRATEL
jgi:hypothetical protein